MRKTLLIAIPIVISIIIIVAFITQFIVDTTNAWKVEITNDYINVRKEPSIYEAQIDTVYKGYTYKVLEIYLDDPIYVWYKIKLDGSNEGWIASDRDEPYVKEINNPNAKNEEDYFIDYKKPILRFFEDTYKTESIDTITLDHLEIIDDSEYEVTYEVYKEEEPIDVPGPQYWIQYTVIDAFGNKTVKVQHIEFEITPPDDKVLDFENLDYQ